MTGVAERFRILMLVLLAPLVLTACATPRTLEISQAPAVDVAGKVEIYVATTREPSAEPVYFSGERVTRLSFARLDITVPRNHKAGELELPDSGAGDPAKHFTATHIQRLDLAPVIADVRREIMRRPANQRDVLVFVHGYNTNFADAAYRFAQIVYDSGFKGVPVLFSWPSRGELLAYPYDRESAYFSRDFLEANLRGITRDIGPGRMDILAHSMGTILTLETLRQAAIRGDGDFGGKLRDVMLAAPDVDIDVFKTLMYVIRRPVTVFVSADDRALDFSRRFAGDKKRLGAVSAKDTELIADLEKRGARIIDLSEVSSGDSLNHGKFASSPRVVQLIGERLRQDRGIGFSGPQFGDKLGDVAGGVVGAVGSTVGLVVTAPITVLSSGR